MSKQKAPDISGMTMSEIQSLVNKLHEQPQLPPLKKAKSGEWFWRVGATYQIRTVSYHYAAKFVGFNGPNNCELVFETCAWIADTGRFTEYVASGAGSEIEPYPDGTLVAVNRGSMSDACEVKWASPRSQK